MSQLHREIDGDIGSDNPLCCFTTTLRQRMASMGLWWVFAAEGSIGRALSLDACQLPVVVHDLNCGCIRTKSFTSREQAPAHPAG